MKNRCDYNNSGLIVGKIYRDKSHVICSKLEENSSKKLREIFHELEGSNVSLLWQKNRQKIKRYVGCIARLPN